MSRENLRQHITHLLLTAILALTVAGCAEEQPSTSLQSNCTPSAWTEKLPENGSIRIGTLNFINSGGELIVAPSTRTQPTVVDDELQMTTHSGTLVTIAMDNGNITFAQGKTSYQISQNPQPLRTVEAIITQMCESNSQAVTH